MQSLKDNSALKTVVKAEVTNIGGHEKSQPKASTDLKLHTDVDPGYNSLDSDSGSPISVTKKPSMKTSANKSDLSDVKTPANKTDLSDMKTPANKTDLSDVKESIQKVEQSIEQIIVEKIRRRSESSGDDQSTPASFIHLHLDTKLKKEPTSTNRNKHVDQNIKKEKSESDKNCEYDGKITEGSTNNDFNALADKMEKNLLISRGIDEKRNHDGTRSYPKYQQNLYASMDHQIPPINTFTRDETPTKKRVVRYSPGANMKQTSSFNTTQPTSQGYPQPGINHSNQNVPMMYHMQGPRDYVVECWPDDFATTVQQQYQQQNQQPYFSTSMISVNNGNSGQVTIKQEPTSPLSVNHYAPCPGYTGSPEHKEAINEIVKYLKNPLDNSYGSPSPPYPPPTPSPQSSVASPCSHSFEKQLYINSFPDTPPESVKSIDPKSPQSVMSFNSDETMPVSPAQVMSPPQVEPIMDDFTTLAIMECEQEVNRLSIECLMEQDAEDKDTCLHIVVTQGRYYLACAIAKRLSQVKGALDIQNNLGQTPVFLATVVNMPFLVRDLITLGADPTIKDINGCTPLHYAAMKGFTTIISSIHTGLQKANRLQDFDVDLKDYDGKTPLHYAIEHHEKKATVFTADSQCASQVLVWNKELISMLLYMNASTTGQDGKSGKTPLHYAVEHQKLDLIDLILENDPNSECVNKQSFSGCTPLHLAVGLKTDESVIVDIVRRLMRNGADVSKENFEKEKPIGLNPRHHLMVRNILSGR